MEIIDIINTLPNYLYQFSDMLKEKSRENCVCVFMYPFIRLFIFMSSIYFNLGKCSDPFLSFLDGYKKKYRISFAKRNVHLCIAKKHERNVTRIFT